MQRIRRTEVRPTFITIMNAETGAVLSRKTTEEVASPPGLEPGAAA